jgi:hypothetical protein
MVGGEVERRFVNNGGLAGHGRCPFLAAHEAPLRVKCGQSSQEDLRGKGFKLRRKLGIAGFSRKN